MDISEMKTKVGDKSFYQENVKIYSKDGREMSITSDSMHYGLWIILFKNEQSNMNEDMIKDYGEGIPESELFDIIKEGLDKRKEK